MEDKFFVSCSECGGKVDVREDSDTCPNCKKQLDRKKIYEDTYVKAYDKDPDSEYRLGLCFLYGFGIDKRDTEALGWFMRAGYHGHEIARGLFLATGYEIDETGDLEDEELEEMVENYQEGDYDWQWEMYAYFDNAEALYELGGQNADCDSDEDTLRRGYNYLKRAMELGHTGAQWLFKDRFEQPEDGEVERKLTENVDKDQYHIQSDASFDLEVHGNLDSNIDIMTESLKKYVSKWAGDFVTDIFPYLKLIKSQQLNDKMMEFLNFALELNVPEASLTLGKIYQFGNRFINVDKEKAEKFYENIVEGNLEKVKKETFEEAKYNLAILLLEKNEIERAQKYLLELAEQTYLPAFKKLAEMQDTGLVSRESNAQVFKNKDKFERFSVPYLRTVAPCYLLGLGVEKSPQKAAQIYAELTLGFIRNHELVAFWLTNIDNVEESPWNLYSRYKDTYSQLLEICQDEPSTGYLYAQSLEERAKPDRAREFFIKSAKNGNLEALDYLYKNDIELL